MAIKSGGKTLTARQQKAKVLEWTGWTTEQYNKEYDKLRNKARAYEKATGAAKGSIDVADLLARDARSKYFSKRYGEEYKPTAEFEAVSKATSVSSGRTPSKRAVERINKAAYDRVGKQFSGVITKSKYSQDIIKEVQAEMQRGSLTPEKYKQIVEKYARMLGAEKEQVRAFNQASPDPYEKIYFKST